MVKAVQQQKRVCQIGTQQRSGAHFRDAVHFVRSGKLGHIYLCRTWITNNYPPTGCGNPADEPSPPPGVNYDLWLGPAPKRPFNRARFHHHFRWFWDYGNGLCLDWGVHLNDVILWAMQVKAPLAVHACGGKHEMKDISDTPRHSGRYLRISDICAPVHGAAGSHARRFWRSPSRYGICRHSGNLDTGSGWVDGDLEGWSAGKIPRFRGNTSLTYRISWNVSATVPNCRTRPSKICTTPQRSAILPISATASVGKFTGMRIRSGASAVTTRSKKFWSLKMVRRTLIYCASRDPVGNCKPEPAIGSPWR
jgi:hypothetical protein